MTTAFIHTFFHKSPSRLLRDLTDPDKRELGLPSLGELSNALLQINGTIGQSNIVEGSIHMEGTGRKEAI